MRFNKDAETGNGEGFMLRLHRLFAGISYDSFSLMGLEQHYQNVLYLIFKLLGYYCHTEFHTSRGRIDMVVKTAKYTYIFEFKLNKSAQSAIGQINDKDYTQPFRHDGNRLIKIGANFSSKAKNLDNWIIEEE